MGTEGQDNGAAAPISPAIQLGQPQPGAYEVTVEPPPEPNNERRKVGRRFGGKKAEIMITGENEGRCCHQASTAERASGAQVF